jgi:hypothetical protein
MASEQEGKWHVQKLLARKKQQVVRRWLRHVENLSDTEEEWFTSVNQKLEEPSVMRKGDQLKVS